jgi:hypothetical protein
MIGKWDIFQLFIKKGKKDEYENYRGITVLNIFSRLYRKMVKYFLDQEFAQIETEEQAGFRVGRSTIDNIFCLKHLIEKKMAVDQPLYQLQWNLDLSISQRSFSSIHRPPSLLPNKVPYK